MVGRIRGGIRATESLKGTRVKIWTTRLLTSACNMMPQYGEMSSDNQQEHNGKEAEKGVNGDRGMGHIIQEGAGAGLHMG